MRLCLAFVRDGAAPRREAPLLLRERVETPPGDAAACGKSGRCRAPEEPAPPSQVTSPYISTHLLI